LIDSVIPSIDKVLRTSAVQSPENEQWCCPAGRRSVHHVEGEVARTEQESYRKLDRQTMIAPHHLSLIVYPKRQIIQVFRIGLQQVYIFLECRFRRIYHQKSIAILLLLFSGSTTLLFVIVIAYSIPNNSSVERIGKFRILVRPSFHDSFLEVESDGIGPYTKRK
jgi:hypothetical protein